MLSTLILTISSTVIIGAIVLIILNLFLQSKDEDKDENNETSNQLDINEVEVTKGVVDQTSELRSGESDKEIAPNEDLIDIKESIDVSKDNNNLNENLLKFEELIENDEQIDEFERKIDDNLEFKPNLIETKSEEEKQLNEELINEAIKEIENELIQLDDALDQEITEDVEVSPQNRSTKESAVRADTDFWNLEDTQNLLHLNKSRPKKCKSRPSVKVIFTSDETDGNGEDNGQPIEDPITKNARELVENLFDNLEEDVNDFKNRSKDMSEEDMKELDLTESDISMAKSDEPFEELAPATGEYKKFDEFSDCFRSETQKHEFSRKVRQISSVKDFEITVNSSEQLNDENIDKLFKNFIDGNLKTEAIEENFVKVSESESIEVRHESRTHVSHWNSESLNHSKTFTERSLSNSSLSKMSLEDLDVSLRSSKSRLSETIDNVTKPLRSSPTVIRRSLFRRSSEEGEEDNSFSDGSKRIQIPIFGTSQSSLMNEMKEKQFRKSLRPTNDSVDDNNSSEQIRGSVNSQLKSDQ